MFEKLVEALATRVSAVLAIWLVGAAISAASAVLVVGVQAVEGNTEALARYEKTSASLVDSVDQVMVLVAELRESAFGDKLLALTKQQYKLDHDPDDIKPQDMSAAVDFCSSDLFADHEGELLGSSRAAASMSCSRVRGWLVSNAP